MSSIGLLLAVYQDHEFLDECLSPWIKLKKELGISIAICHGMFKEYKELGFEDNDIETLQKLYNYKEAGKINYLYIQNGYPINNLNEPIYQSEVELRNQGIKWLLNNGADWIKLIGSDEIFNEEQIRQLFQFINNQDFICSFRIRMKNYVFDKNHYILDFCPPRIYKVNYLGYKFKGLHEDDSGYYENGKEERFDYRSLPNKEVPRINPKHMTWLDDERSRKKVAYQTNRWGIDGCSFAYNKDGKLCFNEQYFVKHRIPHPEIYSD